MLKTSNHLTAKELASELKGKLEGRHWKCRCPAHDDTRASLSISEKAGKVLVRCHAGCSQGAVIGALREKRLWPERGSGNEHGRAKERLNIVATYDYVDETGVTQFQVVRFAPKDFRQRRPDGRGGWAWNRDGVRDVPYRLPELLEAIGNNQAVLVVEGEKDVDNLWKLGVPATSNAGGAGKWKAEHAAHFKGGDVVIIPDNDDPGRQHANSVASSLTKIAARVRILQLSDVPPKGDISDWIANGGTVEKLWSLVDTAASEFTARSNETGGSETRPTTKSAPEDDPPHWIVEPWPEPVSSAQLLNEICAVISRYMVLPKHAAEAMAMWVLHAWALDAWEISPLLIIVSPTKQCGKSTLMTILYWITPRSELISNATASPIFRLIEDAKPFVPTFLLDEGDSYLKPDKEDLRGILNSGWMRVGARVIRTDGDGKKRQARRFSTWASKVIATIKAVADTLMDRGVIVKLRRKAKSEKVERFRMRDTEEFSRIRRQARRWADDNVNALRDADPDVPTALQNRPADNWRALIAVADAAGEGWPSRAREAALALSGVSGDQDRGVQLLRDIRRVFEDGGQDWLGAETLVNRLVDLPETPWAEWRRGERPITSRGVAHMLEDFEIHSDDKHRPRRYWKADFKEAWASYLSIGADLSGISG
jgi:hypothetical protein